MHGIHGKQAPCIFIINIFIVITVIIRIVISFNWLIL